MSVESNATVDELAEAITDAGYTQVKYLLPRKFLRMQCGLFL